MAGIESLMQGPVPGQAPQQPMPGMMPQQGAATPAAMVGPLSQMHMQQLVQLMLNPRPDGPPLYAVISAISEQQKKAQAQEAVQRQLAMSQGQQAAQQPPIAQQLVAKAMQPTQMAAHGGIMQGYSGGGAVAFQSGGPVQKFQYGAGPRGIMAQPPMLTLIDGLPIYAPGPDKAPGETEAEYQARKQKEAAEADEVSNRPLRRLYRYLAEKIREPSAVARMRSPVAQQAAPVAAEQPTDTGDEFMRMLGRAPVPVPAGMRDTRGVTPETVAAARQLGSGQQVAAAPEQAMGAPTMKLPALPPERMLEKTQELTQSEKLAADQAALVERLSKASPEVLAARENLQRIMGKAYDPQKKTLEEAKDLFARGIGGNAEALGRMAAAMGGAKYLSQGLAAAAGAGSQFVGEQRKRVESLQDEYNKLQSQLEMTMAQAQYADIVGDDKLKREALTKAEEIKKNLFDTQRSIRKESFGEQVQQAQGIAALQQAAAQREKARADIIQAGKPSELQQREALYRRDPSAYEAMFGPKESAAVANLVRAVNSDPLLKNLAEMAKLDSNAEGRYNARYKELVATHAPQLLLGAGGGGGGGSLEAATAIARGGK